MAGNGFDYNITVPTFYKQLRDTAGYWTMTTGKDDLTKGTSLGFKLKPKYGNCTDCLDGDGKYHLHELGWSDALRFAGKHGVMQQWPEPYEMYGFFLRNKTLPRCLCKHIMFGSYYLISFLFSFTLYMIENRIC